jgi:hypothetical protein
MHGAAYRNHPRVVQLLADKGARIAVWNRKNKAGPDTSSRDHRTASQQARRFASSVMKGLLGGTVAERNGLPLLGAAGPPWHNPACSVAGS